MIFLQFGKQSLAASVRLVLQTKMFCVVPPHACFGCGCETHIYAAMQLERARRENLKHLRIFSNFADVRTSVAHPFCSGNNRHLLFHSW